MQLNYDMYQMIANVLMPYVSMLWCDIITTITQLSALKGISLDTIMYVYLAHPVRAKYVQPKPQVTITFDTVTIITNAIPYEIWANKKQIPHGNKHTIVLETLANRPKYRLYRNVANFVTDMRYSMHAQYFTLKDGRPALIPFFPGKVAQYALARFPGQIRHIKGAFENALKPIICVYSMSKAQYSAALHSYGRYIVGQDVTEYPLVFVEAERKWSGKYGYMRLDGIEFNNAYFKSLVPYAKPVSVYGEDPELLGADAVAAGYGFEILVRSTETIDILNFYRDTDEYEDPARDALLDSIDVIQTGTRYVRALNIPKLIAKIEANIATSPLAQDEQAIVAMCRRIGYNYIDINGKLQFVDVAGQPVEEPVTTVHLSNK